MRQTEWRKSFDSTSAAVTCSLGERLGRLLQGGEVIALVGDLGCGKTTFTKGLSLGLGLKDARHVCSPTYVLEHIYDARLRIHHYDAYRLGCADEFVALGFQEHLDDTGAVLIVEWADRVVGVLPDTRLDVTFTFLGSHAGTTSGEESTVLSGQRPISDPSKPADQRRIVFSGTQDFWRERLDELKFPTSSER